MTDAALDRLSFTLPDWRGALKRRVRRPKLPGRVRRPKLPDNKRLILVAVDVIGTVFEGGIFAWSLFVPCLFLAAGFAIDGAINVRAIRRGYPLGVPFREDRPLAVTVLALFVIGTAWAVAVLAG